MTNLDIAKEKVIKIVELFPTETFGFFQAYVFGICDGLQLSYDSGCDYDELIEIVKNHKKV